MFSVLSFLFAFTRNPWESVINTSLFATGSDPAETAALLNRDLEKIANSADGVNLHLTLENLKILYSQTNA